MYMFVASTLCAKYLVAGNSLEPTTPNMILKNCAAENKNSGMVIASRIGQSAV